MKRLITVILMLVAVNVWGAALYHKGDLTGGIAGTVDNIDVSELVNGARVIAFDSTYGVLFYVYDDDSGLDENIPIIIKPDKNNGVDYTGDGRWIRRGPYGVQIEPVAAQSLISSVVASGTTETFGPTGSGATNIVQSLDSIPLDADYAIFRVYIRMTTNTCVAGSFYNTYVSFTNNLSGTGYRVLDVGHRAESTVGFDLRQYTTAFVKLDSSNIFKIGFYDSESGGGESFTPTAYFSLIGWGSNN